MQLLMKRLVAVKTYTFLIGQKYKNTDADIDIYIDGNLPKILKRSAMRLSIDTVS